MTTRHPQADPECDVCCGTGVALDPNVLPERIVVERCELCAIFDDDWEAACTLARPEAITVVPAPTRSFVTIPKPTAVPT